MSTSPLTSTPSSLPHENLIRNTSIPPKETIAYKFLKHLYTRVQRNSETNTLEIKSGVCNKLVVKISGIALFVLTLLALPEVCIKRLYYKIIGHASEQSFTNAIKQLFSSFQGALNGVFNPIGNIEAYHFVCRQHAIRNDLDNALIDASSEGGLERVRELLNEDGIDINAENLCGWTALMCAVYGGYTEIVLALLAIEGINLNAVDTDGETALLVAVSDGHTEIALALLEKPGIDINTADNHGSTALSYAESRGHLAIADAIRAKIASQP